MPANACLLYTSFQILRNLTLFLRCAFLEADCLTFFKTGCFAFFEANRFAFFETDRLSFAAALGKALCKSLISRHGYLGVVLQLVFQSGFSALIFQFVLRNLAIGVFRHVHVLLR